MRYKREVASLVNVSLRYQLHPLCVEHTRTTVMTSALKTLTIRLSTSRVTPDGTAEVSVVKQDVGSKVQEELGSAKSKLR